MNNLIRRSNMLFLGGAVVITGLLSTGDEGLFPREFGFALGVALILLGAIRRSQAK